MNQNRLLFVFCFIVFGSGLFCSTSYGVTKSEETDVIRKPVTGSWYWLDDFLGEEGAQPGGWMDDTQITGAGASIFFDKENSYAIVSRTAAETDDYYGYVSITNGILVDTDQYNILEIRLSVADAQAWKLGVADSQEGDYHYVVNDCPAPGTYTVNLNEVLNWTGHKSVWIKIGVSNQENSYIKVDYWSLHKNSEAEKYFWRDDFIGAPNTANVIWNTFGEKSYYTSISYTAIGEGLEVTRTEGSVEPGATRPWGKILAPAIDADLSTYHYLQVVVSSISPGASWKVDILRQGGDWKTLPLPNNNTFTKTGTYTFDLHNSSAWNEEQWSGVQPIIVEFVLEGSAGYSAIIESIRLMGKPGTDPEVESSVFTCSVPNPFLPHNGQETFIHFDRPASVTTFTIKLFNVKGQLIRTMVDNRRWDGKDQNGKICESGMYLYQLEMETKTAHGNIVLIK